MRVREKEVWERERERENRCGGMGRKRNVWNLCEIMMKGKTKYEKKRNSRNKDELELRAERDVKHIEERERERQWEQVSEREEMICKRKTKIE